MIIPVIFLTLIILEMTMQKLNYFSPNTIKEVFSCIAETGGKSRFIAGGTDIMIFYANAPDNRVDLIDVSSVQELQGIKEENGYIIIGGAATHSQVAESTIIQQHANVLATACSHVGSKQIRNLGTVAGNIITALPAADSAVALASLDAECEVYESPEKSTWMPLLQLYAGVGKSTVQPTELLSRIRFKINPNRKTSYQRMVIRKALSLPMLCTAVSLTIKENIIEDARIILAPAGPAPLHAQAVENFLKGKTVSEQVFKDSVKFVLENTQIRSSAARGSKEYREKVLPVYVLRALKEAAS